MRSQEIANSRANAPGFFLLESVDLRRWRDGGCFGALALTTIQCPGSPLLPSKSQALRFVLGMRETNVGLGGLFACTNNS